MYSGSRARSLSMTCSMVSPFRCFMTSSGNVVRFLRAAWRFR
jgi:hypothetical protein